MTSQGSSTSRFLTVSAFAAPTSDTTRQREFAWRSAVRRHGAAARGAARSGDGDDMSGQDADGVLAFVRFDLEDVVDTARGEFEDAAPQVLGVGPGGRRRRGARSCSRGDRCRRGPGRGTSGGGPPSSQRRGPGRRRGDEVRRRARESVVTSDACLSPPTDFRPIAAQVRNPVATVRPTSNTEHSGSSRADS
jgi:hypothetical protein